MADNVMFKVGKNSSFENLTEIPKAGSLYLSTINESICHLDYSNGSSFLNITPRLLLVENGGTGLHSIDENALLYGGKNNTLNTLLLGDAGDVLAITENNTLSYLKLSLDIGDKKDSYGYIKQVDLKVGEQIVNSFEFATPSQVIISRWED